MIKRLVLLSFILAMAHGARAQAPDTTATEPSRLVIEYADSLVGAVQDGARIRTLLGARMRHEDTHLRARRAIQYMDRNEVMLIGSVEIAEQGDSLRADSVLYNSNTRIGYATGNVWLTDGEVVVLAPSARYDTRVKHAVFDAGVTLVDSTTTLRSESGDYWVDERRAEFAGDVRLDEDRSSLVADSITYFRDDEISIARGGVAIVHFEDEEDRDGGPRTLLFGDFAYNDNRRSLSRSTGTPLLVRLTADSLGAPRDTLVIRAAELEAVRSDSLHRLTGVGDVRIWQPRMSATGDSLVYDQWQDDAGEAAGREEARLYTNPIGWVDDMQLSGDTLRIVGRDGGIDSLFVRSSSFVASLDTTLAQINQIKGRDLLALFISDSLRSMTTGPNAEAIYFLKTDEDELRGAVRGSGDEIVFRFRGGDLHRVSILSGTEGDYTSAENLPDPFRLDGFRWNPVLRPGKYELLGDVDLDQPLARRPEAHAQPINTDLPDHPDGIVEGI